MNKKGLPIRPQWANLSSTSTTQVDLSIIPWDVPNINLSHFNFQLSVRITINQKVLSLHRNAL